MDRQSLCSDPEKVEAMDWLSDASGNPIDFHARITSAQNLYREYVASEDHL